MAAVDFQLPALQTPQTQTPEQNAQALALIENSRSLAEQRQAQAEQRQQQAAAAAQVSATRSAWQAAMQASQGDPDAAAAALDKVNPDAAAYGREQTNTARTKALKVATDTADLHTKIVGQTADLLNSINTQDPNDYAAKVLAVRGMAGNDKNMQQFLQTTLPMPGEQGFDPSQIPQYVQRAQNAAIPYKDYWDKMQASVTAANNGDAVKSLAYALDAEKNGSPQDLLKTIASHRALGMKSDVAQPFVDAITSGAYKADPLFFAKLGGITNPKEAGELTGTIPGTTTPTEAAKKDAAEQAMAGANLAVRQGELKVAQDKLKLSGGTGADPEAVAAWVRQLRDPQSGVTLTQVPSAMKTAVVQQLQPGEVTKLTAQDLAMMNLAKKTIPSIDRVEEMAKQIDAMGLMGTVGGRWRSLVSGESAATDIAGLTPQQQQLVGQFVTEAGLLTSGIARVHGGARGGGSPQMQAILAPILEPNKSTLETYIGHLEGARDYMNTYAAPPDRSLTGSTASPAAINPMTPHATPAPKNPVKGQIWQSPTGPVKWNGMRWTSGG